MREASRSFDPKLVRLFIEQVLDLGHLYNEANPE